MSKDALFAGMAALLLLGCAADPASLEAQGRLEGDNVVSAAPAFELTGRVVDNADIISEPLENELTEILATFEKEVGPQLVVATTPSLDGRDIAAYSLDLAHAWGVGSAERNDGLLLLVAPNEQKVRIEVGIGLEASVKDEEASQIIQSDILPHFREGDFENGIKAGVESLIQETTPFEMKEAA